MRYGRLLTRLYNTPLLISQNKLDLITSNVTLRLLAEEPIPAIEPIVREPQTGAVGVIRVMDSLVSKNGAGSSGATSYEAIVSDIKRQISAGAKTLYFYVSSHGGEAGGLFGLTDFIHSLPAKYNVETIGFTDDYAQSAAYAILASTQKAFATSTANIGSIGAISALIDVTEADKENGIKYHIIRSKSDKALGNPHEEVTSAIIDKVKAELMVLDTAFNNAVNRYRPALAVDKIISLKGDTFFAEEALSLGLIDGIVSSFDELISKSPSLKQKKIGNTMELNDALAENIKLQAEVQKLQSQMSLEVAKAKLAEQDRILGIIEAQKTFGLPQDAAVKFIKTNMDVATATSTFEIIKEQVQMQNPVPTNVGLSTGLNSTTVPNIPTQGQQPQASGVSAFADLIASMAEGDSFPTY